MSDETKQATPETLADALAAARTMLDKDSWIDEITAPDEDGEPNDYAQRVVRANDVRDALDRIKAAAERERAELRRQLRNEIQINDALATVRPQLHYVDDVFAEAAKERAHEIELAKLRAPGNAAAIRKALIEIDEAVWHVGKTSAGEKAAHRIATAALAAPARNCDRFATAEEAMREFDAMCDQTPYCRGDECVAGKYRRTGSGGIGCVPGWLFAPAKGGAE